MFVVVGAECAWCDPVLIYRHIPRPVTHWNFSPMPLVPSVVEHTSIGPGSGDRDYTVPALHKGAAACPTGVWEHLIRYHCDTQTMVHTSLVPQFFGMLNKALLLEFTVPYYCTIIDTLQIGVYYFYLLPPVFENRCSALIVLKK